MPSKIWVAGLALSLLSAPGALAESSKQLSTEKVQGEQIPEDVQAFIVQEVDLTSLSDAALNERLATAKDMLGQADLPPTARKPLGRIFQSTKLELARRAKETDQPAEAEAQPAKEKVKKKVPEAEAEAQPAKDEVKK